MKYKTKIEHENGFTIENEYPDVTEKEYEETGKKILSKIYDLMMSSQNKID